MYMEWIVLAFRGALSAALLGGLASTRVDARKRTGKHPPWPQRANRHWRCRGGKR